MAGNDSNTKLLCHWNGQDGGKEIVDDGATGHIVTLNGTAQTSTAQKKIGNCSLYFDGNSDYLTVPDSGDWTFGTGNFTIEGWVYLNDSTSANENIITDADASYSILLKWQGSTNNRWQISIAGGATNLLFSDTLVSSTWYHVALVKYGGTYYLYRDGVSRGTPQADATSIDMNGLLIGRYSTQYFNGFLDEMRISNTARYTSDFTPSTTAFTSDANTKLLLHCESHDVGAGGSYLPATFVGTAQIDTAQKEFGTGSLLLDGDSDYVTFPDSADWDYGADNFTMDFWIRFNAIDTRYMIFSQNTSAGGTSDRFVFQILDDNTLYWFCTVGTVVKGEYVMSDPWDGLAVDTWYHIALVRNGTDLKIYINGVSQTLTETTAISTNAMCETTGALWIGGYNNAGSLLFPLNGYIDEFRISKGIARWTANFDVPTAEYSSTTTSNAQRSFCIII